MVIEDNEVDREAISRGFAALGLQDAARFFENGDRALEVLAQSSALPCLVLLDLNLPGTDGCDVLAAIKNDVRLRSVPVVVLTSSRNRRDVQSAYLAGASSYVLKPAGAREYVDAIKQIATYWLTLVILPTKEI